MRWTERQRAMLREMGVRMWGRPAAPDGAAPDERAAAGAGRGSGKGVAPVLAAAPTVAAPTDVAPAAAMSASPAAVPTKASPCDWLVVGEPFDVGDGAAGEQERLLDHMLQSIGVSRSAPTRVARAWHVALAEGAAAALGETLEHVRPRCALALGRAAAQALLGIDEPIGRSRGRVHRRADLCVVVTFPLAYLLRNPTEKAKAWADLCLAVAALEASPASS
jgi:uracil-DNA glycosylase family 4